jgi:Protein of unknown function (DUF2878)
MDIPVEFRRTPGKWERWINLLGYQITWFITVTGAGHGKFWPACVFSAALCAGHLATSSWRALDTRLIVLSALLGTFLDGFLATTGLLQYSTPLPSVPLIGTPLWIVTLWIAFSTTLTRSIGWLRGRRWLTIVFGALGGPLAYWAAATGGTVIAFPKPAWQGLLAVSIGWALALSILVRASDPTTSAQVLRLDGRQDFNLR